MCKRQVWHPQKKLKVALWQGTCEIGAEFVEKQIKEIAEQQGWTEL